MASVLDICHVSADSPEDALVDAAGRLKSGNHHPNCIGIQIVQIGKSRTAKKALRSIMECENGVSVAC